MESKLSLCLASLRLDPTKAKDPFDWTPIDYAARICSAPPEKSRFAVTPAATRRALPRTTPSVTAPSERPSRQTAPPERDPISVRHTPDAASTPRASEPEPAPQDTGDVATQDVLLSRGLAEQHDSVSSDYQALCKGRSAQLARIEDTLRDRTQLINAQRRDAALCPHLTQSEAGRGEHCNFVPDYQHWHAPRGRSYAIALPQRLLLVVLTLAHGETDIQASCAPRF